MAHYRSRTSTLEVIAVTHDGRWACSTHVKLDRSNRPEIVGKLFGFEEYDAEGELVARIALSDAVPDDVIEALEARAIEAYLERTEPEDDDGCGAEHRNDWREA